MSNIAKLGIVATLVIALGAIVIAKRSPSRSATPPADTSAGCCALPAAPATQPVLSASLVPATQLAVTPLPRLVDLGAGKCIPCKKMAPILEELKTELAGKLDVQFIDVWLNPDAGQAYSISLIPTQIFYDASGKELSRHEGFMPKEDILARFKEHGIDLAAR